MSDSLLNEKPITPDIGPKSINNDLQLQLTLPPPETVVAVAAGGVVA